MAYLCRFAGASSVRGRLVTPGEGVPEPGLEARERGPAGGRLRGHPPAARERAAAGRSRAAGGDRGDAGRSRAASGDRGDAGRSRADDGGPAAASGDRGVPGYCRCGARSVRSAGDRRSRAVLAWCQYG